VAVRVDRLGVIGIVAPENQYLDPAVEPLPSQLPLPAALLFKPLAPAPTPTETVPKRGAYLPDRE